MRTKALILSAAVTLAAVASTMAQTTNVYSVNAVGYVSVVTAPASFGIIANPLNTTNNNLQTLLPNSPVNTIVYKYDPLTSSFTSYTKRSSGLWTGINVATAQFNPGEGFFIQNQDAVNPMTNTFVGEVLQGTLTNTIIPGFSMLASQIPQSGRAEADLGIPAQVNDVLYQFVNGSYQSVTRRANGSWTGIVPGDAVIGVGEGFFYSTTASTNRDWTRVFSANN